MVGPQLERQVPCPVRAPRPRCGNPSSPRTARPGAQPAQPEYGHRVTDQGSLMPQIDSGDLGQIDVHMKDVATVVCGMPPGVAEDVTHQPILDQNVGNEMLNCVAVSDM